MNKTKEYMYISGIGNIYMKDVIVYYDKPLTFTCVNDLGYLFIASCSELEEIEKWILLPVTRARLTLILRGGITAFNAFKDPEGGYLWDVTISANNYSSGNAKMIYPDELEDDDLPDDDIVYDINGEDTFSIKSCERNKLVEDSVNERREILDISLELKDTHVHEVDINTLSDVLSSTQKLINLIAHKDGLTAKVPKHIRDNNTLIYSGNYAASFGVRLKANNLANIMNESEIQNNINTLIELIESKSDFNKMKNILQNLNPSLIRYYKKFLSMLKKKEIAIRTSYAFPNRMHKEIYLSKDDISKSLEVLDTENEILVKNIDMIGSLVAVNTVTNTFTFETSDDESISGHINTTVSILEYRLPRLAKISVKCTIKSGKISKEDSIKYELLDLNYSV